MTDDCCGGETNAPATNETDSQSDDTAKSVEQLTGTNEDGEIESGEHALPAEKLVYPTFEFDGDGIDDNGRFDLSQDVDREGMITWLRDLADGLESHDVGVEDPERHVRFGVGSDAVEMAFDPDDDHRGELTVTFRLKSRAIFVADDLEKRDVGARGDVGFIPLSMLTTDRETFRCYNWIEDPTDP